MAGKDRTEGGRRVIAWKKRKEEKREKEKKFQIITKESGTNR